MILSSYAINNRRIGLPNSNITAGNQANEFFNTIGGYPAVGARVETGPESTCSTRLCRTRRVAGEALPAVDQTMRHNPARGIMQEIDGKRRSGADHLGARSPAMIAA